VVRRDQHVAVHLADVLDERQVKLRPGTRVEMHDLQILRYRRAVLVDTSVERDPLLRTASKAVLKAVFRS